MTGRTVKVVTSVAIVEGRCKYCRARILWAHSASEPGKPSRALPFDPPRPWALSTARNDDTGIVVETWSTERLHFHSCAKKPARKTRPARGRVSA